MLKLYSISLGCPKNRVDTERALAALRAFGPLCPVDDPESADCVFINTCGFIAPAVEESVRTVVDAIGRIQALPAKKRPLLAVAGCLIGRYGIETLAPDLSEVDLFLDTRCLGAWGNRLIGSLVEALAQRGRRISVQPLPEAGARLLSTGPSYAWLKISDGCRHSCAFCIIPAIRGKLVSTPAAALKREASLLLEQGVQELALVAQDLTAWGSDCRPKRSLPTLLDELLPLPGLTRLRLMYLYPSGLSRELLAYLKAAGPPFVPYFDVPLQHAAASVLRRMGRPFAGSPKEAVDRIRDVFPKAVLRTSVIAGFPGERPEDVDELARFIQDVRFHHLGVFAYQAEEGTSAARLPDQIPTAEKERRRDLLMTLQAGISAELLEGYVGTRQRVLVDAAHPEWPGLHIGRTWFQAPESDGITYVSGTGVTPGAMVETDITEASTYDLVGLTD
jgi:tRNA-2-methylthio-N6-dimethylallyladenosine synthase/ribosomal protein S12 methylthiotransferase